ncbi:tRNA lysidine(34) synthetase TilS [[Lactobacillus] timonensis]|uniref:tRNA lysidine(34) synthetase TilS n=1 Tax=[Lactobacillus] timonensis TaxID=1970790 RepID=UPI000C84C4FC|nr:tRNA lysidine(34) synthetase TilS [[Lactobacillus] timonensis]
MSSSLYEQFKRHLHEDRFFNTAKTLVVAVSTGVDSMVLLELLQRLPYHPRIVVAHVNHELRQQSWEEEKYLQRYCQHRDLELHVIHWRKDEHPTSGIEAAGRQVRYHFFRQLKDEVGAEVVMTAHHGDDLAETMLMKLVRGGQLGQLVGIEADRPFYGATLIRPLLPFVKSQLYDYARQHHVKWYEDVTNRDLGIERNRFRHQILPSLVKENPAVKRHLYEYHHDLADLLAFRNQQADIILGRISTGASLRVNDFQQLTPPARHQVLTRWLNRQGLVDFNREQLRQLEQLLMNKHRPQAELALTNGLLFKKSYRYAHLVMAKANQRSQACRAVVKLGHWLAVNDHYQVAVLPITALTSDKANAVGVIWLPPRKLPLTWRTWRSGDQLRLKGGGHQSVERVMINNKVPQAQRRSQLVLVDADDEVLWVVGYKTTWRKRPARLPADWQAVQLVEQRQKTEGSH